MTVLKASNSRAKLYQLIDEASASHRPVLITGKRNNAVLVSEEDWSSIKETLYLLSVPRMRQSIVEGLKIPVSNCVRDLKW
ncbi:MAG: type II toxin-antitoxin system Phd/YefM family antitoxin [Acidobacteriia bacterium]|nr:type II toxin-antitoxin system Phd/YefM family antitoxin [Terriglobia bacterium]